MVHRAAPLQTAWPASGATLSAPSRARRSVLFATRLCRRTRSSPTRSAEPAITRFIESACLSGSRTAGETRVRCAGTRLSIWGLIRSGGRIRGGEGPYIGARAVGEGGGVLLMDWMISKEDRRRIASQRLFTTARCQTMLRMPHKDDTPCSRFESSWANGCRDNAPEVRMFCDDDEGE